MKDNNIIAPNNNSRIIPLNGPVRISILEPSQQLFIPPAVPSSTTTPTTSTSSNSLIDLTTPSPNTTPSINTNTNTSSQDNSQSTATITATTDSASTTPDTNVTTTPTSKPPRQSARVRQKEQEGIRTNTELETFLHSLMREITGSDNCNSNNSNNNNTNSTPSITPQAITSSTLMDMNSDSSLLSIEDSRNALDSGSNHPILPSKRERTTPLLPVDTKKTPPEVKKQVVQFLSSLFPPTPTTVATPESQMEIENNSSTNMGDTTASTSTTPGVGILDLFDCFLSDLCHPNKLSYQWPKSLVDYVLKMADILIMQQHQHYKQTLAINSSNNTSLSISLAKYYWLWMAELHFEWISSSGSNTSTPSYKKHLELCNFFAKEVISSLDHIFRVSIQVFIGTVE